MVKPKHHFGQHFLTDLRLIDDVLNQVKLASNDHVVEIGPGMGVLTRAMAPHVKRLDAIEIDLDMRSRLEFLKAWKHVRIVWQDALDQPLKTWYQDQPFRLISNLPYQITSPILFECLEAINQLQDVVLLLQQEVVSRLCAEPNTKAYGQLTVLIQAAFDVKELAKAPPSVFNPPPKVASAFVHLVPKGNQAYSKEELSYLVKKAFLHRRKMLRVTLKDVLHLEMPFKGSDRPENVSVSEWIKAAEILHHHIKAGNHPHLSI